MKITIEIEESVYNIMGIISQPLGIGVELFVARLLTQIVALIAVNPDAVVAIHEKAAEFPEYRQMLENLEKMEKPVPGEE